MSDEDVTRTLATCPQHVVCVGLVEFGERHDTRTKGAALYTAADRRSTNWVSARGRLNAEVAPTRPTRASGATSSVGRVDDDVTRCYDDATRKLLP